MKKLSFLVIAFISVTVIFYGFFLLTLKNLSYYLALLGERVEIVVFIDDKITENQEKKLIEKIKDIKIIEKIKYTSKAEVLKEFKKNKEFARQIKILGENPLPATIDIYLKKKDPEIVKKTAEEVKSLKGVEEIYYTSIEAENLLAINKVFTNLSRWGNVILILFIIIPFIALSLTIKSKKIVYGGIDAIIGGGIGFWVLHLLHKYVFTPNFKTSLFFTKSEVIVIFFLLIMAGIIVRIPKNVSEK